ncbi:glycosyltransferase family 4 protein [Roseisalinus antarcticus]|uniref:Putative teichuronic acid biosynthesis glycosyltransferase TuaC n=1 Tax=Roseisalinus antarcticus TaxID=254357 RepID=A0A1Y5THH7_9RHOB|nr:glycosyltransferase family 4 protein [Roseisalinus antarcticus]SLN64390.1 Putative teichuronic acid biosynthesis glycosyltransferase TuaC [Roseisalinus antarcticus]
MTPTAPSPDHVLIVGDFASVTGGQAKVAIDNARLLAEAGTGVTFFAACGPVAPELAHPGIRVVCLDQRTILDDPSRLRAMANGIWNRQALAALRAEAARHDPARTVLHCHGHAKALSPSVGRVLAGGPLRCVYTMHEYFLACPNGGFYDYQRQEICTRRPLGLSCLTTHCDVRAASHKAWRVVRGAVGAGPGALPRGLRDIIYISETQRRAMTPWLPEAARLHRVSNPIKAGGAPVAAGDNRKLVFVGRLSPEKGALMLARAAKAVDLPVLFIGEGPEAEAIRAANPEAEITGWLTHDAVQQRLGEARALVFPSLWYEGQPLVPIEALLRGIPVICGSWSAAAEEVRDGENGLVYAAPTQTALEKALRRLPALGSFESGDLAARVSPEAHLARLHEVYGTVLAG